MLIHDLLCRWRQGGKDIHEVVVDGDRIVINKNGRACNQLSLSAVDAVRALNRDAETHDEIFLVIDSGHRTVWISERFAGFDRLSQEIESRFPLTIANWYWKLSSNGPCEDEGVLLWKRA